MKYIFLDTNTILHFTWYTEVAWKTIVDDEAVTIVFAPVVIDELDFHKSNPSKKVQKKAKTALSRIDEILDGKIPSIPTIFIDQHPSDQILQEKNLSPQRNDNLLFASILGFSCEQTDEKILITDDTGFKIRATPLGIRSIKPPESNRLADELDPIETELKNTKQELAEHKNRIPIVRVLFKNKDIQLKYSKDKLPDEKTYIEKAMTRLKWQVPHAPKNGEEQGLDRLRALSLPMNRISDSQIEEYNKSLDKYYKEYEKYLEKKYYEDLTKTRQIEIQLLLSNTGTSPANDIDVHVHFPDGFELKKEEDLEDLEEEPIKPEYPLPFWQMRSFTHNIAPLVFRTQMKMPSDEPWLSKLKKTNSYDVEFKTHSLKHNQEVTLPKLYVCFDEFTEMKSFSIDYSLMIANVPNKVEGRLHIVIESD